MYVGIFNSLVVHTKRLFCIKRNQKIFQPLGGLVNFKLWKVRNHLGLDAFCIITFHINYSPVVSK